MLLTVEAMAERYGMLPSEVFTRATTVDLSIFNNVNIIRDREDKKRRGESIADTIPQDQVEKVYAKFKETQNGNDNKQKDLS